MIAKEKIAAVACGDKMFRVSYLHTNQVWIPVWNAETYDNFEDCDNAAKEYCRHHHYNAVSEYVSLR